MDGFYSIVFPDPHRPRRVAVLLSLLGPIDVGRIRDAWVEKGEHGPVIAVYTRNGGGNREHHPEADQPAGLSCKCTGCIATHHLPAHPQYRRDADDEFDCTYATFYFSPPESHEILQQLEEVAIPPVNMSKLWEQVTGGKSG